MYVHVYADYVETIIQKNTSYIFNKLFFNINFIMLKVYA